MPLRKGKGRKTIAHNISKMMDEGRPHDQAVAAAMETARRSGAKMPKRKRHMRRRTIAEG
jgi:hypothetical protein